MVYLHCERSGSKDELKTTGDSKTRLSYVSTVANSLISIKSFDFRSSICTPAMLVLEDVMATSLRVQLV